jgi:hypothetical protein
MRLKTLNRKALPSWPPSRCRRWQRPGAEEVRPGRRRQGDQDRRHPPVFGPGVGLRRHRQGHRRLLRQGQRRRRHQRPQDQVHRLDDGYNPAKTVEMARKLVEEDEALLVFNPLGTPPNTAIHKYLNQKKVPQLFVATGATKWGDPKNFPWTMGWQPNYQAEGRIYAEAHPRDQARTPRSRPVPERRLRQGLPEGLRGRPRRQGQDDDRRRASYEVTDPTVDSQMVSLKGSGADVFFNITTPKFAAQAIKKAAEIGWKPMHLPEQRLVVGRLGAEAGRARERRRRHLHRLHQGPDRPAMGQRQGLPGLGGLDEEVLPERQPRRRLQRLRLHRRAGPRAGAEAVRRQPDGAGAAHCRSPTPSSGSSPAPRSSATAASR